MLAIIPALENTGLISSEKQKYILVVSFLVISINKFFLNRRGHHEWRNSLRKKNTVLIPKNFFEKQKYILIDSFLITI